MTGAVLSASFLDGRMADWGNDDLMMSQYHRDFVESRFPGSVDVFDFPELRALFDGFDKTANANRKRRQRNGFSAIMVAGTGAALAAVLPIVDLLGGEFSRWLFAFAAILTLAGFGWAVLLILADKHKETWLEHRLLTERLRQFYFQQLLSDPALAARALTDPAALIAWKSKRAHALSMFEAWLNRPVGSELLAVIDDVNLGSAWFDESWLRYPPLLPGAALDDYFTILRIQRVGVQRNYVREKLTAGVASPETRLQAAQISSWVLTLATIGLTVLTAALLFDGTTTGSTLFAILASSIALAGVLSTVIRVLSEGLQLRPDCERYHWYRDAIREVEARLNNTDPGVRMVALQEFERTSYREMRDFLKTHKEARFNFA
ncbi:MAG: hypothetical protein WCL10_19180 [Novosphingobium sp.]|uniref:hypothetical protein n=1 Tax=Novosphingobium sp. TaxID=1874826 RepID=UPI003017A10F